MPDRLTYTVTGRLTAAPSDTVIASAKAVTPASASAASPDVPGKVGTLAAAIAGGQETGGATAQALAAWLSSEGWFSHGSPGEHSSLAGHGSHRIAALLSGEGMVGDSEQYASAMALMAQELGLNSRVVLGFVPKGGDGTISAARSAHVDGQPVTEFTGNDVEAWTEIEFEKLGWVAFFPTPPETKTADDTNIGSPSNADRSARQPPGPLTEPPREEPPRPGGAPTSGVDERSDEDERSWRSALRIAGIVMLWLSPIWLLIIVAAMLFLHARLRLRMVRNRGTPRDRLIAGWRSLSDLARYGGLLSPVPCATRRMQAARLCDRFPDHANVIRSLAEQADHAAFSGEQVSMETVQPYWRDVDRVRACLLASLPRRIRWLIPFIPIGARRHRTGA
nr:transglutaminase-like domain-containing protein [Bifidobacterium pongonis]